MDTAFHPSFLSEIRLEHGPVDLIGRFLRYADTLNRAQGVVLSFATLEELQDVNERNRDSWKPLFPAFNPKLNAVPPDQAFCLLGRGGEVVSAQAARLYSWEGTNLRQEAESLRWFYGSGGKQTAGGEMRCNCALCF
jgi:hypothetical protein